MAPSNRATRRYAILARRAARRRRLDRSHLRRAESWPLVHTSRSRVGSGRERCRDGAIGWPFAGAAVQLRRRVDLSRRLVGVVGVASLPPRSVPLQSRLSAGRAAGAFLRPFGASGECGGNHGLRCAQGKPFATLHPWLPSGRPFGTPVCARSCRAAFCGWARLPPSLWSGTLHLRMRDAKAFRPRIRTRLVPSRRLDWSLALPGAQLARHRPTQPAWHSSAIFFAPSSLRVSSPSAAECRLVRSASIGVSCLDVCVRAEPSARATDGGRSRMGWPSGCREGSVRLTARQTDACIDLRATGGRTYPLGQHSRDRLVSRIERRLDSIPARVRVSARPWDSYDC